MKVKLLSICAFFSIFIFQPAYGYIVNISVWKNEKTGKWIKPASSSSSSSSPSTGKDEAK